MYHQNTLKIFLHQYVDMFAVSSTVFCPDLFLKGNMSKHDIFKSYFAWTPSGIHMLLLPDNTPLSHLILIECLSLFCLVVKMLSYYFCETD